MSFSNRIVIILFFALSYHISYSQSPDKSLQIRIDSVVSKLKKSQIDTICVYQGYCVGCFITWKGIGGKCNYDGFYTTAYILWKKVGVSYITLLNSCFNYSTTKVVPNDLWTFCTGNIELIKSEAIKSFSIEQLQDGKKIIVPIKVDHSYHEVVRLIIRNEETTKYLDDYDFEKTNISGNKANVNYEYNINTKTWKLALLLNSCIHNRSHKLKFKKLA
ncbi:MAG: hypothetical protein ACHQHN_07730 [Sphingobacteriales bacterium]